MSQLEGSLSSTDPVPFPPYLIPDTSSLCTTLPLIRQLAQSNRSIIVIPLAGEFVDWLQSLKQFFISVSFHILVASLTLMALF